MPHLFNRCLRRSCSGTTKKRRLSGTSCSCWETWWSCRTSRGEARSLQRPPKSTTPHYQCFCTQNPLCQAVDQIKAFCAAVFLDLVGLYMYSAVSTPVQVSRRSGCVTWSDWFSVCLHHPQTAGDHVPCVHQAALHRGRCTAGRAHTTTTTNNNNRKKDRIIKDQHLHESAKPNSAWQSIPRNGWAAAWPQIGENEPGEQPDRMSHHYKHGSIEQDKGSYQRFASS